MVANKQSGNNESTKKKDEVENQDDEVSPPKSRKGKEKMDVDSLILGTETFPIQQPTLHNHSTEPILAIVPKHSANDQKQAPAK